MDVFRDSIAQHRGGPESGMAVPHVVSLQSIIGTAWHTYWHGKYDEALRDSQENADAMRNDAFLMSLLEENKRQVCSLNWHIEVDNDSDPWQKAIKDGLQQMLRGIPNIYDLNWYLLENMWYGRYAAQFSWKWKMLDVPALPIVGSLGNSMSIPSLRDTNKMKTLAVRWHMPYEGDKIGYDYDGCPYILVSQLAASKHQERGAEIRDLNDDLGPLPHLDSRSAEFGYTTTGGKALFLRSPSWRQRFAIATGNVLDGPFGDPEKADMVHGVGIRSVVYWYWWLREEFLANVADWCERTGLGVRLWYYEQGNIESEKAIDQAARDQSQKLDIKIPYDPKQANRPAVEMIDTTGHGADLLLRIVQYIDGILERYIVGQSMSGGSDSQSSGFGDTGRATMASDTKLQITKRNATKLGDCYTLDIVDVIKRWTYGAEFADMPARMVFDVDRPDAGKWVEGAKAFVEFGGKVVENQARSVLGLSAPRTGETTLGGLEQMQNALAASGHIKPTDGMAPGENGDTNGKPSNPSTNGHAGPLTKPEQPVARFEQPQVTVHNHLPRAEQPAILPTVPERYHGVQGPLPPNVLDEIMREAQTHAPRQADFIRAVMEAMQHTESPWEAIQLGRQAFLGGQALNYQREQARAAVEVAIPEMETREAVRKAVVAAAEQAREQEAQAQRSDQEAERVRYEQAELAWRDHADREEAQRYEQERDREAQLLKALEKLKPDSIDYDRFAKALKDSPIVVHVEVPKPDALDLTPIAEALKAMPAPEVTVNVPEPKPRTVKIKKNKDGDYTAETK